DPGLDTRVYPLLIFNLSTGIDQKWYKPDSFLVSAGFKDMVRLERDMTLRSAATLWSVSEHGYDNRLLPALRISLMRVSDAFVLSYAQANTHLLDPEKVRQQEAPAAFEADPLAP